MNLKIGDVVMVVGVHEVPSSGSLLNRTGVVKKIDSVSVAVEFDEAFTSGHNADGIGITGKCWYVPLGSLLKMEPVKDVVKKVFYMMAQ